MSDSAQAESMATSVLDRLRPVCSADKDRVKIATPFAMTYEGRKWACATDGHVLAALPFDGELRTNGPNAPEVIPAKATHKTTLAALRAFAGEVAFEMCEKCEGSGQEEHDCNCSLCTYSGDEPCGDCDGKGKYRKQRPGQFGELVFDRNFLAMALLSAPADGEVRIGAEGFPNPILFRNDEWIAVVMPINTKTGERQAREAARHVLTAEAL